MKKELNDWKYEPNGTDFFSIRREGTGSPGFVVVTVGIFNADGRDVTVVSESSFTIRAIFKF